MFLSFVGNISMVECPYCKSLWMKVPANGAFPPRGAGRFGGGREGAVLLRSVTRRVSTADSTLMVGGV